MNNEDPAEPMEPGEERDCRHGQLARACDRCAGLYESLDGLGFCDLLGQDLRQACREYAQMQRDGGVFRGQMVMTPNDSISGR